MFIYAARMGFRAVCLFAAGIFAAHAESISAPNASFEAPATEFVSLQVDSWQKLPKPDWFVESPQQMWDQLIGVFKNTAPGSADHIDNIDGDQAIYLFSVPQAGLFQDNNSIGGTNTASSREFDAKFTAGHSYTLTVGVIGSGGNMPEGASMLASLYYRDAASNMATVAALPIVHSKAVFPTNTHLVDFTVSVPEVKATDAWAGKYIGIMFVSTAAPDKAGGYWDLDNVRLEEKHEGIEVPNHGFESPSTEFVDLRVDSWQKLPKPDWFQESPQQMWDQLIGVFKNTAPGSSDHIDNIEGRQAIYLFSVPQAGIFQDNVSLGGTNTAPSREFDAKYEVGSSYRLTVGAMGGGGNMPEGASMLASLYYRDATDNMVTIAATPIVHSKAVFPTNTHLVDFEVAAPAVKATDAWAGKNIGIMFVSTAMPDKAGGYWDLDNVRLKQIPEYVPVPNHSFESPATQFVSLQVDSWQKLPKPDWFVESPQQMWDQLIGVFQNTAPGSSDHIGNIDGDQAIYLFAVPQAGFFQDDNSIGGTNSTPSRDFDGKFLPGSAYRLTVGVIGGGGNMAEGASMMASLYYRDAASNVVTVASAQIVHSKALFPTNTHLVDVTVTTTTVKDSDAWSGKNIGIMFVSTVAPDKAGGYWDLDNVRLSIVQDGEFTLQAARAGNELRVSWPSAAGKSYQLQGSDDFRVWTTQGSSVNGTGGEVSQAVPLPNAGNRFFRVLEDNP